ncbi:transcriptional regulator, IclR family [Paraburkholderia atlantica]|uniref:Transcriptional regulator, IclR family n=1 Tax=Paraburkholderia atlantica TaxID=2654982 RepID=D5WI84_PARAM|nr:IclR family transcriptional regulator [Paraburkholderia atlantica]ADG18179.1 transcriptional regulator, IclR family [Paraburkholderia atlantica]
MTTAKQNAAPGSVERTFELLRILATAGHYGLALTQISESARLPHSTVHRLLHRLTAERMVVQRELNKRYVLGPLAFELGLAASQIYDLRQPCRPILAQLAEEIGDTVYLSVRSGSESVCEDRYEGPSTIRVITLEVGSRRPLGLGAGGLAILSAIPEEEREQTIDYLTHRYGTYKSLQEKTLRKAIDVCRNQGFSLIRSQVTLGTTAVGVAILDTLDNPVAAVSVAAVDSRMSDSRITVLHRQLQSAAACIKRALHNFPIRS